MNLYIIHGTNGHNRWFEDAEYVRCCPELHPNECSLMWRSCLSQPPRDDEGLRTPVPVVRCSKQRTEYIPSAEYIN